MRASTSLVVFLAALFVTAPATSATRPAGKARTAASVASSAPATGNFFVVVEPSFLQTTPKTGGGVLLTLNDSGTPAVDLTLQGADRISREAWAPRATVGWKWNHPAGVTAGMQGRFLTLESAWFGPARLAPGTVELTNFSTDTEWSEFKAATEDVEATLAFSRWGATVEGSYGGRRMRFLAQGEVKTFGVFTTGNFINLSFSNGSEFRGDGPLRGLSLDYQVPKVPVRVFLGWRKGKMKGYSNSYGRSTGTVASSPSPPLVGAATVSRNGASSTQLEVTERRVGVQAEFGAPAARVRSFARVSFEQMGWYLNGPPTGGAGFGGTIGTLTTNGFARAGLGNAELEGWTFAMGLMF